MKGGYAIGFAPAYCENSRILILGSFPSVKSRAEGFYYGHPQNRFWKTLALIFGEEKPVTTKEKRALLLRHKIALWDVVEQCYIEGSKDESIRGEKVADIPALLQKTKIEKIFCNGGKSFSLLKKYFPAIEAEQLSSTSPANPRFSFEEWKEKLTSALKGD